MIVLNSKPSARSRSRRLWLLAVLLPALIILANYGLETRAGIAVFHPQSCLGGWQDPQLAAGETDSQVAILRDSLSEIFCGNFQGDIPKDVEPKTFRLKFDWQIDDGSGPSVVEATTTLAGQSFPEKAVEILDVTNTGPTELTLTDSTSTASTTPPILEVAPNTTPETSAPPGPELAPREASPAASQNEAPTSWWWPHLISEAIATTTTATAIIDEAEKSTIVSPDDWLEVFYTLDSTTWHSLGRVSRDNWQTKEFALPLADWVDLSRIQISVRSLPRVDKPVTVRLDSLLLMVDYESPFDAPLTPQEIQLLPRVEVPSSELFLSPKKDFSASESPAFILNKNLPNADLPTVEATSTATSSISIPETVKEVLDGLKTSFTSRRALASDRAPIRILSSVLTDPGGRPAEFKPVLEVNADTINLTVPKLAQNFRPGKYHLTLEVLSGRKVLITTEDFYWGVLALNANQSVYRPGERAFLQFAALNDSGHTLCTAKLHLTINGPGGQATFDTGDDTIQSSKTCGQDNVTDEPDYFAYYLMATAGTYDLELSNLETGHKIQDHLVVGEQHLNIERVGATRINPFKSDYLMTLRVTADHDFHGTLTEKVPEGFVIADNQTLTWSIDLKAGETVERHYRYQAPKISPKVYLLGPATLASNGGVSEIFTENREWQLASDTAFTSTQTGNWNVGTTWGGACASSCSAGTDYPGSSDTATIANLTTVTLAGDEAATSVTINNGGTLTDDGSNRTLTIGGAWTNSGTFTANTSKIKFTTTATLTTSTTFYQLEFNGVTSARTFTLASGTTFTVTATTTISGSANVTINNASGGISAQGPITITNTATGGGGTATITINGTGNQTLTGSGTSGQGRLPKVTINKSSGTLTLASIITVAGNWTYTAGTLSVGTSTVVFGATLTIAGSMTFGNIEFNPTAAATYTLSSGTFSTTTNLTFTGTPTNRAIIINTGTIDVTGDISSTNAGSTTGGSATINILGTGTQNLGTNGGLIPGKIVINKSSGTLNLVTCTILNNWTYTTGTVSAGTSAITILGTMTLTGGTMSFYDLTIGDGTTSFTTTLGGNLDVDHDLRIQALSVLTTSGSNYSINVGRNWTNEGTFTANSGTVTLDGSSAAAIAAGTTFYNLTITPAATKTYTFTGHSTSTNTFTLAGSSAATLAAGTGGQLNVTGGITVTNTNTSGGGDLILFITSTGNQAFSGAGDVYQGKLPKVTIDKTGGTLTLSNTINVANNWTYNQGTVDATTNTSTVVLTPDSSSSLTLDGQGNSTTMTFYSVTMGQADVSGTIYLGGNLDVDGNLTISNANTFDVTGTNYGINIAGNWTNSSATGVFQEQSGTVTFDGSTASALTLTNGTASAKDFYSFVLNKSGGATATLTGALTANRDLTASAGTLDLQTYTLSVTHDLTVDGGTLSAGSGNIAVSNNLALSSGTITAPSSGSFTVTGNWSKTGGTFADNSGTVTFNGGGNTINSGGVTANDDFQSLTINESGSSLQIVTNALKVNGTLGITAGTLDLNGQNITIGTLSNSDTIQRQGGETVTLTNNDTDSGTWKYVGDGTSAATTQTVKDFGTTDYYNLVINDTAASNQDTFRTNGSLTVAGTLNVSSSTLDISTNSNTMRVDGVLTVDGGVLTATSGTIDANSNVTISSGTLTAPTGYFYINGSYNKSGGTFTNSSGTVVFDSTASGKTIAGTLTGSSGFATTSFSGSGGAWTFSNNASTTSFLISDGTVTAPALLSVSANWANAGTFTAGSNTVYFTGASGVTQRMTGSASFYNLIKLDPTNDSSSAVIQMPANATTTVTNQLTLTGIDSNDMVELTSSSGGTRAGLTVSGLFSLDWVKATDNDASLGVTLTPADGTDGGNNANWTFGSLTLVVDGSTETFATLTPGGSLVATSSILQIKTSNRTGFVVTAQRSNSSATMRLNINTGITIPDKTAWVPNSATTSAGNATASSTEPQTLQFRVRFSGTDTPNYASAWWGTDDTTTNALFAGFPTSAQNIANRSTPATATTTLYVLYNVAVPATQGSGTYTGDVVYTATVNP